MVRARRNVDLGGICLEKREEKKNMDIVQTRKENEEKYSVYFWRQKKKKDPVM